MTFRYDQQTEVEGAADSPAGLAGLAGTRVTVHYEERDADVDEPGIRDEPADPTLPEEERFEQDDERAAEDAKRATRIIVHGEDEHTFPR